MSNALHHTVFISQFAVAQCVISKAVAYAIKCPFFKLIFTAQYHRPLLKENYEVNYSTLCLLNS